MYWTEPKIINVFEDKRNIILNNNVKFVNQLGLTTINDETNGKWVDMHTGTEGNKKLASFIYDFIGSNKKMI